jgi:hypothetical protein
MFLKVRCQSPFLHDKTDYRYLQHFRDSLPTLNKDLFAVTGDSGRRWEVQAWAASFHQALEASICDNRKRTVALCYPTNDFGSNKDTQKSTGG